VLGSGDNVGFVHNHPGPRRLQNGDLIHVDFGGKFNGYASDLARMAIVGRPTPRQRECYAALKDVYQQTVDAMRPGLRACDLYALCVQAFERAGFPSTFPHIGHSFSLGGHDNPMFEPSQTMVLEPNMTICLEPVLRDGNDLYHIEDIILITEGPAVVLSDLSTTEQMFSIV